MSARMSDREEVVRPLSEPQRRTTMATRTQAQHKPPPQIPGVVAYVQVADAAAAIELYKRAFGAEELVRTSPDGKKIIHAHLRINGGDLFVNDPFPEHGYPLEQ